MKLSRVIPKLGRDSCTWFKRRRSTTATASWRERAGDGMRIVHIPHGWAKSIADREMNYFNFETRTLFPSTEFYVGDQLVVRTNALACKGPELEPEVPVIGFFGDSVVFGAVDDFVSKVSISNFQALNAGLQGNSLDQTVKRFKYYSGMINFACVAVHTGWHNLVYGERDEAYWRSQLDQITDVPLIAHFSLVADINGEAIERGYGTFLDKSKNYFSWGGIDLDSKSERLQFAQSMCGFNEFIADYCRENGRVLIDFSDVISPRSYNDIAQNFSDLIHPRAITYPAIGARISQVLRPYLAPCPTAAPRSTRVSGAEAKASETILEMGTNYTLW